MFKPQPGVWLPVTLLGVVLLWRQNLSLKSLTSASTEPVSPTPESQLALPKEESC